MKRAPYLPIPVSNGLTYGKRIHCLIRGVPMRCVPWPVGLVLLALATAVLLALTSTVQAGFTLAAATYLLKGTESVDSIRSDQEVIDLATPWIIGMKERPKRPMGHCRRTGQQDGECFEACWLPAWTSTSSISRNSAIA